MTRDYRVFRAGEPAFDLIQQSPVIVTDAHYRKVRDLSDSSFEYVVNAHGNQLLGVDADSETVDVAYLGLDSAASKTYTMPTERLALADVSDAIDADSVAELVEESVAASLLAAARESSEADEHLMVALLKKAGVGAETVDRVSYDLGVTHE